MASEQGDLEARSAERLRAFRLPYEFIKWVTIQRRDEETFWRVPRMTVPSARIMAVHNEPWQRGFLTIVEDPSFPEIPPGGSVPVDDALIEWTIVRIAEAASTVGERP